MVSQNSLIVFLFIQQLLNACCILGMVQGGRNDSSVPPSLRCGESEREMMLGEICIRTATRWYGRTFVTHFVVLGFFGHFY